MANGICGIGFTLQLPHHKSISDVIVMGYRGAQRRPELVYASLREIMSVIRSTCGAECKDVVKDLGPDAVAWEINENLYRTIFGTVRRSLNLGSNILGVRIPLFCDALEEVKKSIRDSVCRGIKKCYHVCKNKMGNTGRLYYALNAVGCVNKDPVAAHNPRLLIVAAQPVNSSTVFNIVLPLGSLDPNADVPDVCRACKGGSSSCAYNTIPVMYCSGQRLLLIGYPICEANSIATPRCDSITTPRCPLEYMLSLQGMPSTKSHPICRDQTIGHILDRCVSHICGNISVTPYCNDVYENAVRVDPLISKNWPYRYTTLSVLKQRGPAGPELSIATGSITLSLRRYKMTIKWREEYVFEVHRPISATVVNTYILSLAMDENLAQNVARHLSALGPQSLPLKTLAVKAVGTCLDNRITANTVEEYLNGNVKLKSVAKDCVEDYMRFGSRGYYVPLRPGVSGLRRLAEELLTSTDKGNLKMLLSLFDAVAKELAGNPSYITPVVMHSFTSLLAYAVIASSDVPEEAVSAFLIAKGSKGRRELLSLVYENTDGGYGFITTLTLNDVKAELAKLSGIVKARSISHVSPLKHTRGRPSPINNCEQVFIDLLDKLSDELVKWAGQGTVTIVPAWVVRLGVTRKFLEELCTMKKAASQPGDVNEAMRLVTERVAYFFDRDFHDNALIMLEEGVRIDLNEIAHYLLTTSYAIDLLLNML